LGRLDPEVTPMTIRVIVKVDVAQCLTVLLLLLTIL
jgi:hypothetical protein